MVRGYEGLILQNLRSADDAESLCELSRIANPCRECSLFGSFAVRVGALCELVRYANDYRVCSLFGDSHSESSRCATDGDPEPHPI
ncbi:hypothetical protein LR48_Vigan09g016000 [Vigna angularis]|uniref:Uncharacterized protein n=1 Tax=Phaseolus angularis TaxID=3914 RepID=A0A0L9V8V9_PHAAN|nr:hypothetical protein LR48_Vigan09g016000 [Vigna angularis]